MKGWVKMTGQHKTLELLLERAERSKQGKSTNGKWSVEVEREDKGMDDKHRRLALVTYTFKHYGTIVLQLQHTVSFDSGYYVGQSSIPKVLQVYGESRSDADAISAMCLHFGLIDRYTFRPVNGGFMRVV